MNITVIGLEAIALITRANAQPKGDQNFYFSFIMALKEKSEAYVTMFNDPNHQLTAWDVVMVAEERGMKVPKELREYVHAGTASLVR